MLYTRHYQRPQRLFFRSAREVFLFGRRRQENPNTETTGTNTEQPVTSPPENPSFQKRFRDWNFLPENKSGKWGFWKTITAPLWAPPYLAGSTLGYLASETLGNALPAAVSGTMSGTRWAIDHTFGSSQRGVEGLIPNLGKRYWDFEWRGIAEGKVMPIARTIRNSIYSLLNWGAHVPGDVFGLIPATGNVAAGTAKGLLSLPLRAIGTPLRWFGFNRIGDWGRKLGEQSRDHFIRGTVPFQNTLETLGDITDTVIDNGIDAVRGHITAYTGLLGNQELTDRVNNSAAEIANAPRLLQVMKASRGTMNGWMRGAGVWRPKHLRGGAAPAVAAA